MHYLELWAPFDPIRQFLPLWSSHVLRAFVSGSRFSLVCVCVSTFFLYVWGMYLVCARYCMVLIFAAAVGACESWCYIPLNLAFVLIHGDLL